MKNIVALSPMYTEDSNNLKKASLNSPYDLSRFNAKWNVPEEFRADVIAVYGEDIYAEIGHFFYFNAIETSYNFF